MVWAVILAAGASSRMGAPKALLPASGGRSFVQAIVDSARGGGASGGVVVVGLPHGDAIRKALPLGVAAVVNPRPERGMLSSVQAGLQALPSLAQAALIWPVDVPFVRADTVHAILAAAPGRLVIPVYEGRGGHPIRIPRARFAEVAALDPERGLKALVEARPDDVLRLSLSDPGLLVDVDTPAEYVRVVKP